MSVEELKAKLGGTWPPTVFDFSYEITFRGQVLHESELVGRATELVKDVESRLREAVAEKLQNVSGPKWLLQRGGRQIFDRAMSRMAEAAERGTVDLRPLAYTTLGELKEIITRPDTWRDVFSEVFGNLGTFEQHIGRLIFIRNEPAHSRLIGHDEFAELHAISKRLVRLIKEDGSRRRAVALLKSMIE